RRARYEQATARRCHADGWTCHSRADGRLAGRGANRRRPINPVGTRSANTRTAGHDGWHGHGRRDGYAADDAWCDGRRPGNGPDVWMHHMMMRGSPRERCEERLAQRAAMIAYTTTKLNLTPEQKPLGAKLNSIVRAATG